MIKMSSLPPGVTDDMTDGFDPHCESCGHKFSFHYEEEDIEYHNGVAIHACDHLVLVHGKNNNAPAVNGVG